MSEVFEPVEHVIVWEEDGVIFIKTREPHGDPVEMNEHETRALSNLLKRLPAAQS
jgi:hypothetical protein